MQAFMTGMQNARTVLQLMGLLWLTCLPLGSSQADGVQSGTFSAEDYIGWLENHDIDLVNYVARVGTNLDIDSPIKPPPIGMRWFSLNYGGELLRSVGGDVGRVGPNNSLEFPEAANTSWRKVLIFNDTSGLLRIQRVRLYYADEFRVFLGWNRSGETRERSSSDGKPFDVAITLMTFEKHECGFASKPQSPKAGDTLILSCSVRIKGMWSAHLIFRNEYDGSEKVGEIKNCGDPRRPGSICSELRIKAEADILDYNCLLTFPSTGRHIPTNPMFRHSKWTAAFNEEVICNFPKVYLQAIPSEVTLLCNNMPCGETVAVGDIVTCVAHGYPQPVFDLRTRDLSVKAGATTESRGLEDDNTEESIEVEIKGSESIEIGPQDVGHMEITCNVSNALGWGYNSLDLEVTPSLPEPGDAKGSMGMPTFRLKDYKWKNYRIHLVNYVAEVGSDVLIRSPIMPAPIGIRWFSQQMDDNMPRPSDKDVRLINSSIYRKTYTTPMEIVYDYDINRRWLKIQKVPQGYSDLFRVFVDESQPGNSTEVNSFDVAITLMTFEEHECDYASVPPHPVAGDVLEMTCSVVVHGLWDASLVFHNAYGGSEIRGETTECDDPPNLGSKFCSTVNITVEADILAYNCRLEFLSMDRHDPTHTMFKNSKWTDAFNKEVVCYLPKVYLEVIPEEVTLLCDNMPCEDTLFVNDTITCVAHGYPQPHFNLHIDRLPEGQDSKSGASQSEENYDGVGTADEPGEDGIVRSASYLMQPADVGRVEITCNVSNALGWGINSLIQEIIPRLMESPGNASGTFQIADDNYWMQYYKVNLVNYIAESGTDVLIMSPIKPVPFGMEWFSQNMEMKISNRSEGDSNATLWNLQNFHRTYGAAWHSVFQYDEYQKRLEIRNVSLGYADVFRVVASENITGSASPNFDVSITLAIFEKHECGFATKPENPKIGDSITLNCSVIFNGMWNVSLVFFNNYDESRIVGETMECGSQPSIGSKICSTVNVPNDAPVVLAYSCILEFLPDMRLEPNDSPEWTTSNWTNSNFTTDFNKVVECYLPRVYFKAAPTDVSFLCNQMPCGETVAVNDIVTCLAHGYPQPVFDIRIQNLSLGLTNDFDGDGRIVSKTTGTNSSEASIKSFADYRIKEKDVGQVRMTCNASNEIGWGYNSLDLEITGGERQCGFTAKPNNSRMGDSLNMYCDVIVTGAWNSDLIFRNDYDESEVTGQTSTCSNQPSSSRSTKICTTAKVIANVDILAYSCRLKVPSSQRNISGISLFQNSTWTFKSNDEIICTLPKIYLEAAPSNITFLCNSMPCGDTALVNDIISCVSHGYPQTIFSIRALKNSSDRKSPCCSYTVNTSTEVEIRGFENYQISEKDVGQVEIQCDVWNSLGSRNNSIVLEVKLEDNKTAGIPDGEDEERQCGFIEKPRDPKMGDSFNLFCNITVNRMRNAYLTFRNDNDESEVTGQISTCSNQPSSSRPAKICTTAKVIVDGNILAYSCRLKFPSSQRKGERISLLQNSRWTNKTNDEIICALPKIYFEAAPSNITFLCNNMPCGDTALVNDNISCVSHGYPQPIFSIRALKNSSERNSPCCSYTVNTSTEVEIRGFENYQISEKDVGQVEIQCYVWNSLGSRSNSIVLEVKLEDDKTTEAPGGEDGERQCGFIAKPRNPKMGNSLNMYCNVIVNREWNGSLIFRNDYDDSEVTGQISRCKSQPSFGRRTKICTTANVIAEENILAYSCRLKLPSSQRKGSRIPLFQDSAWTFKSNDEIICTLPKIYLEAGPWDATILCNNMPCGDTALVNDTITCISHGYPQPVFDIGIVRVSPENTWGSTGRHYPSTVRGIQDSEVVLNSVDTANESTEVEIKEFEDYQISEKDVGKVSIYCQVSNAHGKLFTSIDIEVKLGEDRTVPAISKDQRSYPRSYSGTYPRSYPGTYPMSYSGTYPRSYPATYPTTYQGMSQSFTPAASTPMRTSVGIDAFSLLLLCDEIKCTPEHALSVGDKLLCIGDGVMDFDRFELLVNGTEVAHGGSTGVSYVLQMSDLGEIEVECTGRYVSLGYALSYSVPIIVRGNKTEHGEAGGAIDHEQAVDIASKAGGKAGAAAGGNVAPEGPSGMPHEDIGDGDAGGTTTAKSIGSNRESFVLLQVFVFLIAALVGLVEF